MASQPLEKEVKLDGEALAEAARKNDSTVFAQLYNQYFDKISRFVSFRVSHKETAEDLVAEIFIKSWEGLQVSPPIASFSSWLFTIARNKIIDHYRTKKSFTDLFELENILQYEDKIATAIDIDLATQDFLKILDRLTPDQQQVIRLKFIEDLENEEIAAIMDKTPVAIRVIQHRAIVSLKQHVSTNFQSKRNV